MLEKIIGLDNVGVFRHGIPSAVAFDRATLLYAENGRGKSTLSAVLSSLATGEIASITARHTFGGGAQRVLVRCSSEGNGFNAQFDGKAWSATVPNIVVFDQHFVERNVYAGSEVQTAHHEALLEFALGSVAVKKKQEVEASGEDQLAATKRRTAAEEKLKGYMGKTALPVFLALPKNEKVDEDITGLERRISAAKDGTSISSRAALTSLKTPSFDFSPLKTVLTSFLETIHEDAERTVRAHLKHLKTLEDTDAETWLSQGLALASDASCPFCSQSTEGVSLISTYRAFFDEAYSKLMGEVSVLDQMASRAVELAGLETFEATDNANRERLNVWSPQLALSLDMPDIEFARAKVFAAMQVVEALVAQKKQSPLQPVDCHELTFVEAALGEAFEAITTYNEQVATANESIATYKAKLAGEKLPALQDELVALNICKTRYSPEVTDIVGERQQADADRTTAEAAKKKSRAELDALMESVLGKFQSSINAWLAKFGAAFTVQKLKPTYVGFSGAPRTEYGLSMRGATVPAGKKSAAPCFQTALSDGDKRTLALAFFLAKLFDEPDHANRIVVVDDIFTSLDKHRRGQTVDAIAQMVRTVKQVIVLAHDAFFLKDVSRKLTSKGICTPLLIEATRSTDGYSELRANFELEETCASDFYKHYRALELFLAGTPSEGPLAVAQGLRNLLEGHLHRRFPGHINEGLTVGAVLALIKDAPPTSPLAFLQPCLAGLHELNDFAAAFHHETSGITPRAEVTDSELHAYGTRTMHLLHKGHV